MKLSNVKQFITGVFEITTQAIKKYEEYKELTGQQKMERVNDYVVNLIFESLSNIGNECERGPLFSNTLFVWIIKKIVIKCIPVITQKIYDLIQMKIEGITK